MKKSILFISIVLVSAFAFTGCKNNKRTHSAKSSNDSAAVCGTDSTVYGVCGDGTAMHTLELFTDAGDTVNYLIDDDDTQSAVKGGLFVGDRMAVIGHKGDGECIATNVINLTALMGKWTSIDKNFEIQEGGTVINYVKAETHPWTSWKICNGKLVLNRDTFLVNNLGADSLYLENKDGIFAFKRKK
ncbi:MAG: hypothetical protein WCS17_00555 [Prevotella sp.]